MAAPRTTILALFLLLAAGCGQDPDVARSAQGAAPSANADGAVVRDGDRVVGTGLVVAVPGRPVRLCANAGGIDIGYEPGQEPPPAYCELGVDVTGVDLAGLADRREKAGAVEGRATLTGRWEDGVLTVQEQRPPQAPPQDGRSAFNIRPQTPPCPEPAGGWPRGPVGDNLTHASDAMEQYWTAYPDARQFTAMLRPSDDQVLLGLAVHSEQQRQDAERLLRPVLDEQLCIVEAQFAPEVVEQVRADPQLQLAAPGQTGPFSSGLGISDDLQPQYMLGVMMVTEELRRAADRYPPGLVDFEATITPL